jgi:hypothetical protein
VKKSCLYNYGKHLEAGSLKWPIWGIKYPNQLVNIPSKIEITVIPEYYL